MKSTKKYQVKTNNGITLIALVITIIVLLILAGVTIAALSGPNGILTRANDAKEQTEITSEKEQVELAAAAALADARGGEIDIDTLRTELEKYFEDGKYDVQEGTNEDGTEGYIVTITENDSNGRKYFVDKNGNVSDYTAKEPAEPTPGTGDDFSMGVGAIDIEFLTGTSYNAGEANEPLLDENTMIPIKYDETSSKWIATTKDDPDWYSYDATNRKWANVMLSDGTYTVDTVPKDRPLEESELGSMFVWIPRYAYKIAYFDNQTDKEAYISGGRTDKTKIVGYSDARGIVDEEGKVREDIEENIPSIAVGDNYRPHPVFENNVEQGGWDKKLTGIWVGKFETTEKINSNGANMILPNQTSQRILNVSTMFNRAQEIGKNLKITLDSHMMKNTEWGAVAYLAESKYGRNGTEVSVNQCSSYITGAGRGTGNNPIYNSNYDSSTITDDQRYNGNIGKLASTTGNVYGIYDMSGGANEFVMGVYGTSGSPTVGSSGFETFPESKYYNLYTAKNNSNIGDALYETSGWNSDDAGFVSSRRNFFTRGGAYGNYYTAGVFLFGSSMGPGIGSVGFRVCLAV